MSITPRQTVILPANHKILAWQTNENVIVCKYKILFYVNI